MEISEVLDRVGDVSGFVKGLIRSSWVPEEILNVLVDITERFVCYWGVLEFLWFKRELTLQPEDRWDVGIMFFVGSRGILRSQGFLWTSLWFLKVSFVIERFKMFLGTLGFLRGFQDSPKGSWGDFILSLHVMDSCGSSRGRWVSHSPWRRLSVCCCQEVLIRSKGSWRNIGVTKKV